MGTLRFTLNNNYIQAKLDTNHDRKITLAELQRAMAQVDGKIQQGTSRSPHDGVLQENEAKALGIDPREVSKVSAILANAKQHHMAPSTVLFEVSTGNPNSQVKSPSPGEGRSSWSTPQQNYEREQLTEKHDVQYNILPSMQLPGAKMSRSPLDQRLQATYPPTGTGPGTGKKVYFFSAFTATGLDQANTRKIDQQSCDEIAKLRAAGYSVVVDPTGTAAEFTQALTSPNTAGVYWRGHGTGGQLIDFDGECINPDQDFKKSLAQGGKTVSPALKMVYLGACEAGQSMASWQSALGKDTAVTAYNYSVPIDTLAGFATNSANETSPLGKLFQQHLL